MFHVKALSLDEDEMPVFTAPPNVDIKTNIES